MRSTTELQARFMDLVKDMADRQVSLETIRYLVFAAWPEKEEDEDCDITDDSCIDPCCGCRR